MISSCFRRSGGFPLKQVLSQLPSVRISDDQSVFNTENLPAELQPEAYRYFALSIFWRTSVTDWPGGSAASYRGRLGRKYEEAVRSYLLSGNDLPKNIGLSVMVDFEDHVDVISSSPSYTKIKHGSITLHRHAFMIPGIRFLMLIGDHVDKIRHKGEGEPNSALRFIAWLKTGTEFQNALIEDVRLAKPKGKLARRERGVS